jgi:glycosyltransferase involved in cell wall biosynthesis
MLNQPEMIGLGVYTYCLFRELLAWPAADWPVDRLALIGSRGRLEELLGDVLIETGIEIIDVPTCRPINRIVSLNRLVVRELRSGEVYFYSPSHHGVVVRTSGQVVTVADLFPLLFPMNYRQQYYYYRHYLPRVLRVSNIVITLSDNTARDLARFFPAVANQRTIHGGLRHDLADITPDPMHRLVGKSFFLFVGPSYRHKNADRLLAAFASAADEDILTQHHLVFAGGRREYLEYLKELLAGLPAAIAARVHFLGYVSQSELAWLYGQANATMITSLYEGFGLPALEAMYFGCPVVASRVASLPEVCGEAALFVDPANVTEIADAMRRLVRDNQLRSRLVAAGKTNLHRFNWRQAAEQIRAILCEVIHGRASNTQ